MILMLINNNKPASNTSGPPSSRDCLDCRDWFRWCHPTSSPTRRGEWNSGAMKKRWKNQGWTSNHEKIDEHHGKPPKIKNGTSDWTYFCYIIELPNWFHTFRYLFRFLTVIPHQDDEQWYHMIEWNCQLNRTFCDILKWMWILQ